MKTITKFMIILVLVIGSTLTVAAQVTIKVTWDEGSSCTCPNLGQAYYSVYVAVFDQCSYPYTTVFEHTNIEPYPATESFIDLDEFCDEETGDCYLVIAEVKKWCPDGQGGYEDECHGKHPGTWFSCQELMLNVTYELMPKIELDY